MDTKRQAVLDFILAHAENDERPYLAIAIYGISMMGLLDSGATNTILGGPGWRKLSSLNLKVDKEHQITCTVANGEKCRSLGSVDLPIELEGKVKMVKVLVIPNLTHTMILGADFWRMMGVVPDLRHGCWQFSRSEEVTVDSVALNAKTELTPEQAKVLNDLVDQGFHEMGDRLGCTSLVEHVIKTNAAPIKQRYYPVSPIMQKHMDKEVDKLLEEGIIERSASPWSSPVVLVKKKDQSYRFCVDYRKLNQVSERDAYPIPYVSATLDKLRDAKYLSSLDIKSAYFQVPLSEDSKPLTAFTVPNRGLFQFRRLPMGLANSPATFQRLIDQVLGPEMEPHCFVYLDDIVIVTQTFEQHIRVLREVFRRLKVANLTASKEKCHFCRPELRYLGYVIDCNGLHVDPEKVSALINIPIPRSVSEVRRIIGLASWYRRFVRNFSTLISPLSNLLRKGTPFNWNKACDDAFKLLKEQLITAPVLSCPNFDLPFIIQTDASGFGLGAVLTQQHSEGEKVICYLSRSLTRNERNYSTTERECLAVLWAIEKLRPYVEGSRFTVVTDHYSLVWLNRLQSPSGRLARWAIRLQQYDFDIVHRKGKEHVVPDALSRSVPMVDALDGSNQDSDVLQPRELDKWYNNMMARISGKPQKYPCWRLSDGKLFKHVNPRYPELSQPSDYWREVIPKAQRRKLISDTHESLGHLGVYKTFHKLSLSYYWPKMNADVVAFIRHCKVCHAIKPEQKRPAGLMLTPQYGISRPFELVCADIVGPLPRTRSGYQYILSVADCFSKFAFFFALRRATAPSITRIIENDVFLLFGIPKAIIVDNGVQFKSREFTSLMNRFKVHIKYTALYHPQANPCERINRVLKTMLRAFVSDNHRDWDQYLGQVGFAIRSSQHEVTGYSPNFVVFGRELSHNDAKSELSEPIQFCRKTLDSRKTGFERMYQNITKRLQEAYNKSKTVYDLRRRDDQFHPHQLVWRKNYVLSDASKYFNAKLAPKFVGPFLISKRVSPWTYELKDSAGKPLGIWHAKDLKSHPPDLEDQSE